MKHPYNLSSKSRSALAKHAGAVLLSYRVNLPDDSSLETFVLRFEDEDVEIHTKEISGTDDWFDETNTVEVESRPERDSVSPLGESVPYDGIPAGTFRVCPVNRTITGMFAAVCRTVCKGKTAEEGEFVRAIILCFGDDAIVFDKGEPEWGYNWQITHCRFGEIKFADSDDKTEWLEFQTETRIERIA